MKRRVCCLLLGMCILCLPVQQVYAAPAGPAAKAEEKKEEKPKPHEQEHEHEKPVPPHEKKHEKPVPPHEKEKPVPPHELEHEHPALPHEHEHPKPHEEKKGPLAEKQEAVTPTIAPTAAPTPVPTVAPTAVPTPVPTVAPTATPTPAVIQTVTQPTTSQPETSTTTSTLGIEVAKYALQFVGNPYKYGGTSLTNGADCSGFVQSVYSKFGYSIPRTSKEQAKSAGYMEVELKESELQPGDLIFYADNGVVFHVAMYIGDGQVVHAANSKMGIVVSKYTYMKPYKARRVVH